jgi:hypothetical protein
MNELLPGPIDAEALTGLFAVIGGISFVTITSIAAALAWFGVHRQREQTMRLAIEKGVSPADLRPQPSPVRDFRQGMLLVSAGVGLGIALGISGGLAAAAFAAIPIAAGTGKIAVARATRRLPA